LFREPLPASSIVTWTRNGAAVVSGGDFGVRAIVDADNKSYSLVIGDVTRDAAGMYTCLVVTFTSKEERSCQLHVE
jgi:hypothetical protein